MKPNKYIITVHSINSMIALFKTIAHRFNDRLPLLIPIAEIHISISAILITYLKYLIIRWGQIGFNYAIV